MAAAAAAAPEGAPSAHACAAEVTMSLFQSVIHDIRSQFNQEDVPADPVQAARAQSNMQIIAGAAKLLSTELYTKATHFVLELVQNADDCEYAEDIEPQVQLDLFDDALLLTSNEVGFTEANVRAICAIAQSSKDRRVGAFTGEKGIGFKATATKSEVTYILSNGYRFCFDMRQGAYSIPHLGLICPRWEDSLAQDMEQWVAERAQGLSSAQIMDQFGTRIWMQLRPNCDRAGVAKELLQLDPFMLLNLRKLRHMTVRIHCKAATQVRHFSRSDAADAAGRLSIAVEEGCLGGTLNRTEHHLLCMRKLIQVPADVVEEKREGVSEVEVVFALPVTADGAAAPDKDATVFAFLPVDSYGFRFHIQADFILPSSREGILEDRPWNQFLRDQWPQPLWNWP